VPPIACPQLPSVLTLFLGLFAVPVFFVLVGLVGVGFACLLLRCVREPWFPWVSCARRVVCSGAGRAFLLRCLWRSFVRWRSLSLCVWRLASLVLSCRVPSLCAFPGVRRWASPVASVVRSCSALASSVWSLLPCVPCRLAFGLWRFACPGAQRFAVGSVRSGVSLPSSDGGFAGGRSVSRPGAGALWGGRVRRRTWFRPRSPSVLPTVAGLDDPPLRRSGVADLAFYPNPFAFTLARLSLPGGRQSVRLERPWMSH